MKKLHLLPALPYAPDALQPHISRETIDYHYGKHHATYIDNLNRLTANSEFAGQPLEAIVQRASGAVFENAAQAWNHDFYWHCLSPRGGGMPHDDIGEAIERSFHSFDDFRTGFTRTAVGLFGSGWTWLVLDTDGSLRIMTSSNADTPLRSGTAPLLTCDVWEHAYYIDYRNRRADYLEAFWALVDWEFVNAQLRHAMHPKLRRAANR